VSEKTISCVVRDCTTNNDCDSRREIKFAEIDAPRRLKKNITLRVKKMESTVRPTKSSTATILITKT
jgi:hypothetical protein